MTTGLPNAFVVSNALWSFSRQELDNPLTLVDADQNGASDELIHIPLTKLRTNDQDGSFGIHIAVNPVYPQKMLIAREGLYESSTQGQSIVDLTDRLGKVYNSNFNSDGDPKYSFAGGFTALAYGAKSNPAVVYAAAGDKIFTRRGHANIWNVTGVAGAGQIVGLVIDPDNSLVAYAVDNRHVFRTVDGGSTWTNILPLPKEADPGLRAIQYIEMEDESGHSIGPDVIVVGGTAGVFFAYEDQLSSPTWHVLDVGRPRAIVSTLVYNQEDDVLLAGTFGRGVFILRESAFKTQSATETGDHGRRRQRCRATREELRRTIVGIHPSGPRQQLEPGRCVHQQHDELARSAGRHQVPRRDRV